MEIKNKKAYGILSVFLITLFGFAMFTMGGSGEDTADVSAGGTLEKIGYVNIGVLRGEGSIYGTGYEDHGVWTNIVVDEGLNAARDIFGQGISFGAFDVVVLANGDPATAVNTTIPQEYASADGLNRTVGTYASNPSSAGNWSISTTFTSAGASSAIIINKTCLVNQTVIAGDTMFACVNFAPITLDGTAGDTVFINWTNTQLSG